MSLLDYFRRKPAAVENRDLTAEQAVSLGMMGRPSLSGVAVTEATALTLSAFNRAAKVKSQVVGTIPLKVYQKTPKGRDDGDDHTLYPLLHDEPNPEQSAYEFWTLMEFWAIVFGNSYAEIVRDGADNVLQFWPISPPNVKVGRLKDGGLAYQVQAGGQEVVIPARNMIHLKGPSLDGSVGARLVDQARESLGLSIGEERSAAAFIGNAGRPSLIFSTPDPMKEEQRAALRLAYQTLWAGVDKAGAMMLMTGSMTATIVEPTADYLNGLTEARKFQCEEACRWVGIDPIFVYCLDRSTWNNGILQRLNFLQFSLEADLRQIECEVNRKCFRKDERPTFYAEFVRQSVIRLDPLTQHQVWEIGRGIGIYSANELRAHMNLPPYEGGDEFTVPGVQKPVVEDSAEVEENSDDGNESSSAETE